MSERKIREKILKPMKADLDKRDNKKRRPLKWILAGLALSAGGLYGLLTGYLNYVWAWLAENLWDCSIETNSDLAKIISFMFTGLLAGFIYFIFRLTLEFFHKNHSSKLKGADVILTTIFLWLAIMAILAFVILITVTVRKEATTPLPTNTPIPTQTPIPTFAPTSSSMNNLSVCKQTKTNIPVETNFPCLYFIEDGDYGMAVAEKIYGKSHVNQSGRINELYRDKNGSISKYYIGDSIIIPSWDRKMDLDYYEYYFHIIKYPIPQCETKPFTPCWFISIGQPYSALIKIPDPPIDQYCFVNANRAQYDATTKDIVPKKEGEGVVFVFPICP
ncbi:MAG: hypothetical protein WBV22_06065 [Anaerolineaceae bacterium]